MDDIDIDKWYEEMAEWRASTMRDYLKRLAHSEDLPLTALHMEFTLNEQGYWSEDENQESHTLVITGVAS